MSTENLVRKLLAADTDTFQITFTHRLTKEVGVTNFEVPRDDYYKLLDAAKNAVKIEEQDTTSSSISAAFGNYLGTKKENA